MGITASSPFLRRVFAWFFGRKPAALSASNSDGIKQWVVTEPYLNIHCSLGEGPYYEAENNRLRFVDIIKRQLHEVDLASGPSSLKSIQFDIPVGMTADIEGVDSKEKILIGGKTGIAVLDRKTGKYEYIKRFYDNKIDDDVLRSNDGAVDPEGRLWIGTMNDFHVGPPQPVGMFFHCGLTFHRKGGGQHVPDFIHFARHMILVSPPSPPSPPLNIFCF
jgi:hypothetical protein